MSFISFTAQPLRKTTHAHGAYQAALLLGGLFLASAATTPARAQSPMPELTVTGVANNIDSAKITFTPIDGAQDYRVYDVTDPSHVKYSGQWHLIAGWTGNNLNFARNQDGSLVYPLETVPGNPGQTSGEMINVPGWEVEWNGIQPGQQETLVVEAVDAQGPVPSGNLYSGVDNAALETCTNGMCMVGSNEGITIDGILSTNGQGLSTNMPHVIARSKPFLVGSTTLLPSRFIGPGPFESFATATMAQDGVTDNQNGNMHYTIQGASTWETIVQQADAAHTKAFIENGHFMDVLFDGGTPGLSSLPMHNNHASLAVSPIDGVYVGDKHILHVTCEVDSHDDNRRWVGMVVVPLSDPAQTFYTNDPNTRINKTNRAFFAEVLGTTVNFAQMTGPETGTVGTQAFQSYARPMLFGPKLQPVYSDPHLGPTPVPPTGQQYEQYGHGLDNRTRFDLFLSSTHVSFYEDGVLVGEQDLSEPLGFKRAKIYFAHYCYHTTNEVNELTLYDPQETYWINSVPYNDERHWSNMGYEVLSNNALVWSRTPGYAQPLPYQAPVFAPGS